MASIHREVQLEVSADQAWSVLREVGKPHEAFAGVLTDATIEGDVRTVTFANGMVARERIVDVDEERRRVAYSVQSAPFTHHHASMRIVAEGEGRSRFIWTSDFLPAELAPSVLPLVEAGCSAFSRNVIAKG